MKYTYTKDTLKEAVSKSETIADICRYLGIRPSGGNYKTIKSKLQKFEISIKHFKGCGWAKGKKVNNSRKIPLEKVLSGEVQYLNTYSLKLRLFKENIKKKKCECCGLTEWNRKPIPLELNHIDGDNVNNKLENLEILCPNCHAQTDNYRGKQKRKSSSSEIRKNNYAPVVEMARHA